MKITFIGGGNMGEAMLAAVLDKKIISPENIVVSDVSQARLEHLKKSYHVRVMADNSQAVAEGELVILAIKPQNLAQIMAELKDGLKSGQLVLSIVAGARIDGLRLGLGHNRIVRVMPNTPAQIGAGISVWTATGDVTQEQKSEVGRILGAMGKEIFVADEGYLDMATAISGSGPAYVFLFAEALVSAALEIGLPEKIAVELVLETIVGSGQFARKSDKSLALLRQVVTSPGGTTAEALSCFEKGKFTDIIIKAVKAAYIRARELGG